MKKIYVLLFLLSGTFLFGQAQLHEPFAGTNALNTNGWTTHSGTSGQLQLLTTASDTGNSLSFSGLTTSTGNRVSIISGNSEDVNKALPSTLTGDVYYSALVKPLNTTGLAANSAAGDYFLALSNQVGASVTSFPARLYIKQGSVANTVALGVLNNSGGTAAPTYTNIDLPVGTTVLIVVKYNLATNSASLWINPTPGNTEPAPDKTNATGTTTAPALIASMVIRQGATTGNVEIDEIRVDNTWALVTPNTAPSTDPTISISTPGNGSTIPPTSSFNVTFSVQNFTVAAASAGDGFINYIVDGGTTVDKFDTTPISLTLGAGTHTVDMELVDNGGAPLSPPATASVSFTIASLNPIADIATLRAQPTGATNFYQLTGEATVTFAVAARNQIFMQDATAGILIDDASNIISTAYAQGDGMTGLKGTLNLFNGIIQFLPIENPGTPSSTGNTVTPKVITLAELNANFDAYESQIVKIAGVTIDPTNVTFTTAPATNYAINVGAEVSVLRTQHPESGLEGVTIPTAPIDLFGIVSEFTATSQLFPFYDFVNTPPPALLSTEDFGFNSGSFKIYPNPVSTGFVNIVSAQNGSKTVAVYDILGKQMLRTQLNGTTLDVSQLNNGIYILKIEENGKTTSKKLIVQK